MHFVEGGWFLGMHLFWWLFWFSVIGLFFTLVTPVPRGRMHETPLQVLQRRYAAGDISTEEYEDRRKRLGHDGHST